ncbi:MAG: ribbon-helix-helix domain-containing protein [Thermoplasmata archaeon]
MASETERVTVRLPVRTLEQLATLVNKGDYDTISDAVRAAIDNLLDVKFPPRHLERITVDLPKGKAVELKQLVRSGDSVSLEDAIRNAVREYVRMQIGRSQTEQVPP